MQLPNQRSYMMEEYSHDYTFCISQYTYTHVTYYAKQMLMLHLHKKTTAFPLSDATTREPKD